MAKWIFNRPGTWVYPRLNVTATENDVIESDIRIDAFWTAVPDATPATIPPPAPVFGPFFGTPDGAFLTYDEESAQFEPSTIAPFDENGRITEAGLPERLSAANLDALYGTPGASEVEAQKGQPDGLATLDSTGVVPDTELPGRLSQASLDAAYGGTDGTAANQSQVDALEVTVDAINANTDALMETTASVEELLFTANLQNAVIGGVMEVDPTTSHIAHVFTAPFPLTILSVSFVADRTPMTPDDTNYQEVSLNRRRADGTTSAIVSKATKPTGGEAWLLRTPWTFDNATWNEANRVLAENDMIYFTFDCFGTHVTRYPMCITIRYRPL